MKKSLFLIALFYSLTCKAQISNCGFDEMRLQLSKSNPAYLQQEENVNRILYEQAIHKPINKLSKLTVLTIPIVVHIVHQNGPENVSDSMVIAGINRLNLECQNAVPYYDSTGTDIQIQFCLATVDPYGNPATGITRTVSPYTDMGASGASDLDLKNLSRWDPHLYLNVWIIRNTGAPNPGWATFPNSAGSGIDGILLQYNAYDVYLVHEVGHYLGLHHTFYNPIYNTCTNYNCLLDGDMVCDTPPDNSQNQSLCNENSCSSEMDDTSGFNPFTADVNELPNYMDYTACPLSFTVGQSDRMNASLVNIRNTLLQSNGCGQNPGGPVPVASFTAAPGCGGEVFTNTSINSVGASWDFNSDGQIDDAGNVVTYNPPVSGYYNVTMYAQGYGGVDTAAIQIVYAQHYPYQNYPLVNGYGGLVLSPTTGLLTACEGSTITFQGAPGMAQYFWSNGDTSQNTTFIQGTAPFTISLYTVDSAGLTWSTCYPVPIAAAPAPIAPTITVDPNDTIFCIGQPIDLYFTYSPIWYSGDFAGITGFHYPNYTVTLNNFNNFIVNQADSNGCTSSSNMINIIAQTPTIPANIVLAGGNFLLSPGGAFYQWYFNGSPIPNANNSLYEMTQVGCYKVFYWWFGGYDCGTFSSDSVCITTLGLHEISLSNMSITFNNITSQTVISFSEIQKNTALKILDLSGREIKTITLAHTKEAVIEKGEVVSGIYFLQATDENKNVMSKKILLQ